MTDGKCQSVLDRLLNYVNNTSGTKKSACPSRRKKDDSVLPKKVSEAESAEAKAESAESKAESAESKAGSAESKAELAKPKAEPGKRKDSLDTDDGKSCLPSQICPKKKSCCFIKMQDPCAPCCCETKSSPPPCPPKTYREEPRPPICGCDLCKQNPMNPKCCDKTTSFRGFGVDPRYFEKV